MKKEKEVEIESKIKRCKEDVIFDTVIFIVLTILLLIVAYPLWLLSLLSVIPKLCLVVR